MDERLGIAGSGTIACGLAATAAQHGEVLLWARSDDSADRARGQISKLCGKLADEPFADRVTVVTDAGELARSTFLVEAVAEDHEVKGPVLGELGRIAPDDAIVATTTSSLSITKLAESTGRPHTFCGFHVFNPVTKMPLVELVFPESADAAVRERAHALCRTLGKTAVEVPDVPGFVVNRLLFPYLFSAVRLQDETGLDAESIDQCMKLGAGHPMGPLALLDLVGIDVSVAIGDAIGADVPERLRRMLDAGELGRKTGRGFHSYG